MIRRNKIICQVSDFAMDVALLRRLTAPLYNIHNVAYRRLLAAPAAVGLLGPGRIAAPAGSELDRLRSLFCSCLSAENRGGIM